MLIRALSEEVVDECCRGGNALGILTICVKNIIAYKISAL